MSSKYRAGEATEATTTTAGTDNDATAPQVRTFQDSNSKTSYAKPCIVSVPAGFTSNVLVKINTDAANDFDNDADDDGPGYFTVAPGEMIDCSLKGLLAVDRVSFVTQDAGDDLDDVSVIGWAP